MLHKTKFHIQLKTCIQLFLKKLIKVGWFADTAFFLPFLPLLVSALSGDTSLLSAGLAVFSSGLAEGFNSTFVSFFGSFCSFSSSDILSYTHSLLVTIRTCYMETFTETITTEVLTNKSFFIFICFIYQFSSFVLGW